MTFLDYLARLQSANPKLFAAREIKMTPESLKEQIELAYNAGAKDCTGSKLFDDIFHPLSKRGGMDRK